MHDLVIQKRENTSIITSEHFKLQYDFRQSNKEKFLEVADHKKAYLMLSPFWADVRYEQELKVLFLDYQCKLLSLLDLTNVDLEEPSSASEILGYGVRLCARFIIVAHNCPHSFLDLAVAELIKRIVTQALDHELVVKDHLFVTHRGYISLYQMGLLNYAHLK